MHSFFTQHTLQVQQSAASRAAVAKLPKEGASMDSPLCKLLAPAANQQAKANGGKRKRTEAHPCLGKPPLDSVRMILSTMEMPPKFFSANLDTDPETLQTAYGVVQDIIKGLFSRGATISDQAESGTQQAVLMAKSAQEYLQTITDALQ